MRRWQVTHMQWRALMCGCSIRTSHKGALPKTVLLWIMSVSTVAPDSALRCSMTVGGRTRSRRLMESVVSMAAALPVAGARGFLVVVGWGHYGTSRRKCEKGDGGGTAPR